MREALGNVDGDGVEAIVQFGANLPIGPLATEAERWLGKLVIAMIRTPHDGRFEALFAGVGG